MNKVFLMNITTTPDLLYDEHEGFHTRLKLVYCSHFGWRTQGELVEYPLAITSSFFCRNACLHHNRVIVLTIIECIWQTIVSHPGLESNQGFYPLKGRLSSILLPPLCREVKIDLCRGGLGPKKRYWNHSYDKLESYFSVTAKQSRSWYS